MAMEVLMDLSRGMLGTIRLDGLAICFIGHRAMYSNSGLWRVFMILTFIRMLVSEVWFMFFSHIPMWRGISMMDSKVNLKSMPVATGSMPRLY